MPTYQLTPAAWLARETERAKGVLLVHMEKDRAYTLEELLQLCRDYGLEYGNPEYQTIGAELIKQGVIKTV